MIILKQGKTYWKYILIVFISTVLVGGGILGYQYWWLPTQEQRKEILELKLPKKVSLNLITKMELSSPTFNIFVLDNYLYIMDSEHASLIDISNPIKVSLEDSIFLISLPNSRDLSTMWNGIYVTGNYAFIVYSDIGLKIFDISNPTEPVLVGGYNSYRMSDISEIYVSGSHVYLSYGTSGLEIIDISNPSNPILIGHYSGQGWIHCVRISGNYAYIGDYFKGIRIIDISNPAEPVLVGKYEILPNRFKPIYISSNYAYIVDEEAGFQIIDMSNPVKPILVGGYKDIPKDVRDIYISGKYAYIYAYIGEQATLRIIDVFNPAEPVLVGSHDVPGKISGFHNIYVSGSYVYVTDGFVLQIFEIK